MPISTATATATRTVTRTVTVTRSATATLTRTPTPSVTPTFPTIGPTITYLGVARADGQVVQPLPDTAPDGTPIFERQVASGFFIVVEAKPGPSNRPVGTTTFNSVAGDPNALPNLQIVVSRPLGNGSQKVCDDQHSDTLGGVPAVDPPVFGGSQDAADAINDLACRFDARTSAGDACTRNASEEAAFVKGPTRVQFCPEIGIGAEIAFPPGDTRVTARVTDVTGTPGMPAAIIIRVQ